MPDKDLTLRITLRPGGTAQQPVHVGEFPVRLDYYNEESA